MTAPLEKLRDDLDDVATLAAFGGLDALGLLVHQGIDAKLQRGILRPKLRDLGQHRGALAVVIGALPVQLVARESAVASRTSLRIVAILAASSVRKSFRS
jgi:hypothetical protein